MKVALLHDHLNQAGGAERVLLNLAELFPQAPIYTLIYDYKHLYGFEKFKVNTSFIQKLPGGINFYKWYLPLMPTAIEEFDLSDYDLVISSASGLIKGVLTHPHTLHICYCHTPTRYLWSDTHQYRKELTQNNLIKKILPSVLKNLRTWDQLASQRVNKFIANSNFVANRINNYYHRPAHIIHPPVDVNHFYISKELGNYFLIISRLRPYKRIDLAIKAFNKANIPLKIIGIGEDERRLKKIAKSNIEFLGNVSEKEKRELLSKCLAFINPQEEDFGITAVEAMASGRPVLAYGAGGAKEIIEEGITGKFFEEQTWEDLADTVIRFKPEDYDPYIIKKAAQKFSRQSFKEQIKKFIDNAWEEFKSK